MRSAAILTLLGLVALTSAAAPTLDLEVDATDFPRRLLHARVTVPAEAGELALWFPMWIPGIHAPMGPVENLGGLRVETPDGNPVAWSRDPEALHRILCDVPAGVEAVVVELDYITNQPSTNSRGVDSFGNGLVGTLSWNTVIVYPEGFTDEAIDVRARLRLPEGWEHATALKAREESGGEIAFETVSLRDLVDSPLIAGEHMRTFDLSTESFPPVWLHVTSESERAVELDEELVEGYRNMVAEAAALFGFAPFGEYHFLLTCSDELPGLGLEHLSSSLNGVGERALAKGDDREPWAVYLLPHEFVHAWCGKYRRPAGMFTRDFHTPKHTEMLWIYEGLTQWLGELLAVRAGLFDEDEWRGRLALKISWLNAVTGRGWRPLADTAIASYHLRGGSPNWIALRRGQDYYNEGLLIWLEADTIIRDATDGQRSLDDFCRRFFGAESGADVPDSDDKVVPYELDEVIGILSDIADHDWRGFFEARVMTAQNAMPLDFVSRAGHRLQYANEPSDYLARAEKDREYIHGLDSLGASFGESGNIFDVVPGTPADLTGLAPGMTIQGVNGKKFSLDRMRDAIADSVTRRSIELLLLEGDRFETVNIEYAGGPRYLELVRDESRRDLLSEILKPRVEKDDDGEEEND